MNGNIKLTTAGINNTIDTGGRSALSTVVYSNHLHEELDPKRYQLAYTKYDKI